MSGIFATATAVHELRRETGPAGEAVVSYAAAVHDGWHIGPNANGGYLMAIAGRAMAAATGRPPVTLTAHYLRPVGTGPCEVVVTIVRSGRRFATATATMVMVDGRQEIVRLLGTFGEQQPGGPSYIGQAPVDLPPYEECEVPQGTDGGPKPVLSERLAMRFFPGDDGFRVGRPTGEALVRGWFALAQDEPIDAFALLLAADASPPPLFNTELPVAWAPTVELTVHIRGVPAPGPLRCSFRSRFIHDGMTDEDGEIWDSTGALVAQSRQLALVPRDA
jgi:acyl-coenzyme A thioesterase PaaI-like protein